MQTFSLAFTRHPPHYYTRSSKTFTHRPPKSRHTVYKNTTNAQLHKAEALDPEKCSHSHYLKIDRWGRQQTIIPEARGGQQRKKKNRRLRKQIWVMSSKLNGKPCVRKTGESIHIYCCLDFDINIIERTCFLFRQLTHKEKHKLPFLFDENKKIKIKQKG